MFRFVTGPVLSIHQWRSQGWKGGSFPPPRNPGKYAKDGEQRVVQYSASVNSASLNSASLNSANLHSARLRTPRNYTPRYYILREYKLRDFIINAVKFTHNIEMAENGGQKTTIWWWSKSSKMLLFL